MFLEKSTSKPKVHLWNPNSPINTQNKTVNALQGESKRREPISRLTPQSCCCPWAPGTWGAQGGALWIEPSTTQEPGAHATDQCLGGYPEGGGLKWVRARAQLGGTPGRRNGKQLGAWGRWWGEEGRCSPRSWEILLESVPRPTGALTVPKVERARQRNSGGFTPGTQDVRRASLTLRVTKSELKATKPDLHGSEAMYGL